MLALAIFMRSDTVNPHMTARNNSNVNLNGSTLVFLFVENETTGPYTQAQLPDLIRSGKISETTQAWYEGLPEWVPVARLLSLQPTVARRTVPTSVPIAAAALRRPMSMPPRKRNADSELASKARNEMIGLAVIALLVVGGFGLEYFKLYMK